MIDMTKGSPAKHILVFTIPMFIGSVFQQFYNLTDSIIVGKFLGKEALASVGISFPIVFLLIALIMGATMGITVLISQYYGAKNFEKVKLCIETSFILLAVVAIILTIAALFLSDAILTLLKTPDVIYADARKYVDVLFGGLIFLYGYNSISAILRGLGDSRTPLYLLIFATLVNIGLDLLFIVVFKWGVWGAALATVIAQGFSFIGGMLYLQRINPLFRVNYLKLRFDKDIFLKSIMIGIPTGIQQMIVSIGMMALTRIVNNFGENALAAYTAAGRIDSFAMMPGMNLSMAMSTFVGQNIGAGKHERVRSAIRTSIFMSTIIAILISIIIIVFSRPLMLLFVDDPDVVSIGRNYLLIVGRFYLAFMLMFIFTGTLRGAGDTFIPMFFSLLSSWAIRIPISVTLSKTMGTDGIWWGIPIAWIVGLTLSSIYFFTGRWKKKALIAPVLQDIDIEMSSITSSQ